MNCPRCQGPPLVPRERDGVSIDVCPACRGIWLDRGELDKLIARAMREFDEIAPRHDDTPRHDETPWHGDTPRREVRYYRDHDDDDHSRRDPRRKRSWLESLGDIFD